ncbi:uncharacterized protein [Linepithema humile]|uniref:uncharacterized protein n=1 Tax=Linepithema humile TaxID=83485 RepID=UPI00351E9824
MPNITLFDERNQSTYILEVSEEEATKANKDMIFATRLLEEKLSNVNKTRPLEEQRNNASQKLPVNESEASTSSYDDESVPKISEDSEEKDSFRWPYEAILLFLSTYKEHEDKLTSGKISVKNFWNMISCLLIKKGYSVTGTQCKSKMAGLKNTYKSVKDHNAKSGNNTRAWRYFNVSRLNIIIDKMFNKKPWIAPVSTLDSGKTMHISSEEENDTENNEIILSSKKPKLPMKHIFIILLFITIYIAIIGKRRTGLEQMYEENTIAQKKMHEEAMARQDKLLDILSKLLEK